MITKRINEKAKGSPRKRGEKKEKIVKKKMVKKIGTDSVKNTNNRTGGGGGGVTKKRTKDPKKIKTNEKKAKPTKTNKKDTNKKRKNLNAKCKSTKNRLDAKKVKSKISHSKNKHKNPGLGSTFESPRKPETRSSVYSSLGSVQVLQAPININKGSIKKRINSGNSIKSGFSSHGKAVSSMPKVSETVSKCFKSSVSKKPKTEINGKCKQTKVKPVKKNIKKKNLDLVTKSYSSCLRSGRSMDKISNDVHIKSDKQRDNQQVKLEKKCRTEINKRQPRVASLNASAKVHLLYESEKDKLIQNPIDKHIQRKLTNHVSQIKKKTNDKITKKMKQEPNNCKTIVKLEKPQKLKRKRKLCDDVEIIDTRSCKRLASLNASAILAASCSPFYQLRRTKSIESTHTTAAVEMTKISSTVQTVKISPSNEIRMTDSNHIIVAAQEETVEMIKHVRRVSGKIKDRLLAIEMMERENTENCLTSTLTKDNFKEVGKCITDGKIKGKRDSHSQKQALSNAKVTGLTTTEYQVTKVHINTSQGTKVDQKQKSKHKIETILEKDAVVRKYQFQTKATSQSYCVQMQASTISQPTYRVTSVNPISQGQVSEMHHTTLPHPALTQSPMITAPTTNQAYFNYPGSTPVLHVSQPFRAMTSSTPINPLPIINLTPFPQQYASAFSVPNYAHQNLANHLAYSQGNCGLYQPAGPLIQPVHDPYLIHKPIPYHPNLIPHINSSTDLYGGSLPFHHHAVVQPPNINGFQSPYTPQSIPSPSLAHQSAQLVFHCQDNHYPVVRHNPGDMLLQTLSGSNQTNPVTSLPSEHYNPQCITQITESSMSNQYAPLPQAIPLLPETLAILTTTDSVKSKSVQCSPIEQEIIRERVSSSTQQNPSLITDVQDDTISKSQAAHQKQLIRKPSSREDTTQRKNEDLPDRSLKSDATKSSKDSQSKKKCTYSPGPFVTNFPSSRMLMLKKKRFPHGWSFEGKPVQKFIVTKPEDPPQLRRTYPAIRHFEGDIIKLRDCVFLRSGPRKTDLPFVAKIVNLWETPDEGEMMMSILWYYRPEHTDIGRRPSEMADEIFASKHRDVNSVACIDDKCYVLTYNEYTRYCKRKKMISYNVKNSITEVIVTSPENVYPRMERLPKVHTSPDMVFCCRKVYDFRQKRTLKNPV